MSAAWRTRCSTFALRCTAEWCIRDIADRTLWLEDGQFKELAAIAEDPVCGMAVERDTAVVKAYNGEAYYFCSRGCRNEFDATMEKFAVIDER